MKHIKHRLEMADSPWMFWTCLLALPTFFFLILILLGSVER
jgi:hypothetical protein